MLSPELKSWSCVDHDPIEDWVPDSDTVLYWLGLRLGIPGDRAADLFTVPVANVNGLQTPAWKQRHRYPNDRTITPIVVDPYSWPGVLEEIHRRLSGITGPDWSTLQEQLRLVFHWEYEAQ